MTLVPNGRFPSHRQSDILQKRQGLPLDIETGTVQTTNIILDQVRTIFTNGPGGSFAPPSSMSTSSGPLRSSSASPSGSNSSPSPISPSSVTSSDPGPSSSPTSSSTDSSSSSTTSSSSSSSPSSSSVSSTSEESLSSSSFSEPPASSSTTRFVESSTTSSVFPIPNEKAAAPPGSTPTIMMASPTRVMITETTSQTYWVTTITFLTTSGSSAWVATTTQTLADPSGNSGRTPFSSNTSAIIAVSLSVAIVVFAFAILLFLFCARGRWHAKSKLLVRAHEEKRRSVVRLDDEFTVGMADHHHPTDASFRQSRLGSKGEEANWLGGGLVSTDEPSTSGAAPYYDSSSSSRQGSSSSLPPPSHPSHSFEGNVLPMNSILDRTPSGESNDHPYLFASSDDSDQRIGGSSSQSHVQFAQHHVIWDSSETDLTDLERNSDAEPNKGAWSRLRARFSVPFSPPTGSISPSMMSGVPRDDLCLPSKPEMVMRNPSVRTRHTETTEESVSGPWTPPMAFYPTMPSMNSHIQHPPMWIPQAPGPSSLLNPPCADTLMMETVPSAGPSIPVHDFSHSSSAGQQQQQRPQQQYSKARPPTLHALPAFSYTPPTPLSDDTPPPWIHGLGEPSPPISIHRNGLVDVDHARERQRTQGSGIRERESEERSLRDWVDYSRPVLVSSSLR